MMLVLFMEYRRKAVYTAKARIGFWGMFLVGVFLIVKAKSTGMSVGLMVFFAVLAWQFFWDKCCHSKQKKVWYRKKGSLPLMPGNLSVNTLHDRQQVIVL